MTDMKLLRSHAYWKHAQNQPHYPLECGIHGIKHLEEGRKVQDISRPRQSLIIHV